MHFTDPQPSYSAYREASFGHALLEIMNRRERGRGERDSSKEREKEKKTREKSCGEMKKKFQLEKEKIGERERVPSVITM